MRYAIKAGPTTYPVSEAELADWLKVDNYQDPKFLFALESATQSVISYLGRALLEQEYTIQFQNYPGKGTITGGLDRLRLVPDEWIDLPYPPLISVEEVRIEREDGEVEVIDPMDYRIDLISQPGRITFKRRYPAMNEGDFLSIDYIAGYGDKAQDVPFGIRQAIIIAAAYAYEHFGQCEAGSVIMDSGAAAALIPYKVMRL
jgi:uncharacterized phiE125 gp8 family phage protein